MSGKYSYLNGESDGARAGMSGHVHGVEPGLKHAVWHQDVATATILHELPVVQVHRLVWVQSRGKIRIMSNP